MKILNKDDKIIYISNSSKFSNGSISDIAAVQKGTVLSFLEFAYIFLYLNSERALKKI